MSGRGHKRKRSLQDSPVDLSKMRMALQSLDALKAELDSIQETEGELDVIFKHVEVLEDILKSAKKPRLTFSTVKSEDLSNVGVVRKLLFFDSFQVAELAKALPANLEAEVTDLHSRIKKIYGSVNMEYETGARMILDSILLALTEIASFNQRNVAILPEMKIPPADEVQITHPVSGFQLWLSGNVDYAVIEYENVRDYKDRLLAAGGSRDAVGLSKGRLFLVEAKRQNSDNNLLSNIPEAVSQAIALLKSANFLEVRFCLSDGQSWIFFILKSENGILTYYESAIRRLSREVVENSDSQLREIVQLVCEWLKPTATDLFELQ